MTFRDLGRARLRPSRVVARLVVSLALPESCKLGNSPSPAHSGLRVDPRQKHGLRSTHPPSRPESYGLIIQGRATSPLRSREVLPERAKDRPPPRHFTM